MMFWTKRSKSAGIWDMLSLFRQGSGWVCLSKYFSLFIQPSMKRKLAILVLSINYETVVWLTCYVIQETPVAFPFILNPKCQLSDVNSEMYITPRFLNYYLNSFSSFNSHSNVLLITRSHAVSSLVCSWPVWKNSLVLKQCIRLIIFSSLDE